MKPCVKCGVSDRNKSGDCKACARETAKRWRASHPYRVRVPGTSPCVKCGGSDRYPNGDCKPCARKRATVVHQARKSGPDAAEYQRQKTLQARLNKYRLTPAALIDMLKAQEGVCAICQTAKATHIDHDHETGRVRGILCHQCNIALGCFRDSPSNLRAALRYLERSE